MAVLKVAIVGCGKIADDHVSILRQIGGCEVVAACDREPLMAAQLSDRFSIPNRFTDVDSLFRSVTPDVVHITTPPQSHFEIASKSLLAGAHVLLEKPFTVDADQARALTALASQCDRKITVHHDQQFTPAALHARRLIQQGLLGGAPLHIESYYNYELGESAYARAFVRDDAHWVRQLPGGLLHNVISHGIAKIAEFVQPTAPEISVVGFASPAMRQLGGSIVDELRVIIADPGVCTAYFTFSSSFRPCLHLVRLYGRDNAIEIDHDRETVLVIPGSRYRSVLEKLMPPGRLAVAYLGSFTKNLVRFARNDLHPRSGSVQLFTRFYRSVLFGGPAPIDPREIVATVQIMDEIFRLLGPAPSQRRSLEECR